MSIPVDTSDASKWKEWGSAISGACSVIVAWIIWGYHVGEKKQAYISRLEVVEKQVQQLEARDDKQDEAVDKVLQQALRICLAETWKDLEKRLGEINANVMVTQSGIDRVTRDISEIFRRINNKKEEEKL